MKTTIEISDALLAEARALARQEGVTLRTLVEGGLRHILAGRQSAAFFKLRDASFGGEGLQPEFRNASWDRIHRASFEDNSG